MPGNIPDPESQLRPVESIVIEHIEQPSPN